MLCFSLVVVKVYIAYDTIEFLMIFDTQVFTSKVTADVQCMFSISSWLLAMFNTTQLITVFPHLRYYLKCYH